MKIRLTTGEKALTLAGKIWDRGGICGSGPDRTGITV